MVQAWMGSIRATKDRMALGMVEAAEDAGGADAFVMVVGTGGCLSGVAEELSAQGAGTRVVAVEPAASRGLSGGPVGGRRVVTVLCDSGLRYLGGDLFTGDPRSAS
jgi:cysteine synthase